MERGGERWREVERGGLSDLNQDNLGLNPALSCRTLGKFVHTTVYMYSSRLLGCSDADLAADSIGYLCVNSLHTFLSAWQNASLRNLVGVQLNKESSVKCLEQS